MLSEYMINIAKSPEFADWNKTEDEVNQLLIKYKDANKINPAKVNKRLKEFLGW